MHFNPKQVKRTGDDISLDIMKMAEKFDNLQQKLELVTTRVTRTLGRLKVIGLRNERKQSD